MASIYKRGGRKGKGGYYIAYYERPCQRKTIYAGNDREAAEALARKLEADAMLRRKGVIDPRTDAYVAAEARPPADHLAEFAAALQGRGDTEKHAEHTRRRVERVLDMAGIKRISGLVPSRVQDALAELHKSGPRSNEAEADGTKRRPKACSLTTCNHYLRAVKGFSRWLWRDGRTREDALTHLSAFRVTDAQRKRRALSDAELSALLHVTYESGPVLGMSGPDRAMLYALAVGTGFRANELRSLTPESFALDATPPTVAVEAAYSKRRRHDVQPLPVALAEGLKPWLVAKKAKRPVFGLPDKTAKMLRADLDAAGIAHATAEGVADFHALRHTYVSRLVRSGINVKIVQELARHSTPVLTLGRYTHVDMQDKATALTMVPAIEGQRCLLAEGSAASTAPGTAHALHQPSSHYLARGDNAGEIDFGDLGYGLHGTARIGDSQTLGLVRLEGLEPTTRGLRIRCSTD